MSYIKDAIRTESMEFYPIGDKLVRTALTAFMDVGQELDKIKKAIFYGKGADKYQRGTNLDLVPRDRRLFHAILGIATEAAELVELLTEYALSNDRLIDELGDLNWYQAIIMDEIGVDFETVQAKNIAKLRTRYPEKFDEVRAQSPDKKAEQHAMDVVM